MTRIDLIKKIEGQRKTRIISYATGDRPPFVTKIAGDIIPLLGNLLDGIGKVKKSLEINNQRLTLFKNRKSPEVGLDDLIKLFVNQLIKSNK